MESSAQITSMKWYQRFELWIFLVAVLGTLAWVFIQRRPIGPDPDRVDSADASSEAATPAPAPPVTVLSCSLTRDYANARLDLNVRVRNDSAQKLVLSAPQVRLLTDKGREVPSFFLAFAEAPSVAPHSVGDAELRYWLGSADLEGGLRLEVHGFATPVKDAKPFDLNAAKQGEKRTFQPAHW